LLLAFIFCFNFFPCTVNAAPNNTFTFPYSFSTEDIYGRRVTEKTLGEKEIFFVHYLATWCQPCIIEMPDMVTVAKKYGDRVGFIGLLDDYKTNKAAAVRLAESTGIPFIIVDAGHRDFTTLLRMVRTGYVPTSIMIGRDGKIIGRQIIGAYGLEYANFIDWALRQTH